MLPLLEFGLLSATGEPEANFCLYMKRRKTVREGREVEHSDVFVEGGGGAE